MIYWAVALNAEGNGFLGVSSCASIA